MQKLRLNCIATLGVLVVLAAATPAHGAGFALYESSARGNAMGGALVGDTGDASANYFNPAAMTALPGYNLMVGATAIRPGVDVTTTAADGSRTTTHNEEQWWVPPHAYLTCQLDESWWCGLGVYAPFGLGSEFAETWPGRYNSYNAVIQSVSINPNVAYRVNDRLSLAAGAAATTFSLMLQNKAINPLMPEAADVDFKLDSDLGVGYGGNAGLRYALLPNLAWGLTYRSQVEQTVEGEASARISLDKFVEPGATLGMVATSGATGDVTLPASTSTGLNYQPIKRLNLGLSATYTEWSSYDELCIELEPGLLGTTESITPKDWQDVWRFGAGAEYAATSWLTVRGGYVYDEEPSSKEASDYLIPSDDRHILNLGAGLRYTRWTIDLTYSYLMIKDRTGIPANPEAGVLPSDFTNGDAHMLAMSVSTTL